MNMIDRFEQKIIQGNDGCILWIGAKNGKGYGQITVNKGKRTSVKSHRWIWEFFNGKIPSNLQIDHLCRNSSCVNTDHMEVVTNAENRRRRMPSHCPSGHSYSGKNLRMYRGMRYCRACHNAESLARYYKKRGEVCVG